MDAFPDLTAFIILSKEPCFVQENFASSPNVSTVASTPNTSIITTRPSGNLLRRAFACIKFVPTDWDYHEEQACATYLLHKIKLARKW